MTVERTDDVFDVHAWRQAGEALLQASMHTLLPAEVQLAIGPEYGRIKPETRGLFPDEPEEEVIIETPGIVDTADIGDYNPGESHVADSSSPIDETTASSETPVSNEAVVTPEPTQEEQDAVDFEGLFWVDGLALQWCITNGFDSLLREVYMLGRLDQRADFEGNNAKRFVRARQLGRVAGRATEAGIVNDQARPIIQQAIKKHGSLLNALNFTKNDQNT